MMIFKDDYEFIIIDILYKARRRKEGPLTTLELKRKINRHHDANRYMVESRAKSLIGKGVIETKKEGVRAFTVSDELHDRKRLNKRPTTTGSRKEIQIESEKVDRAIVRAVEDAIMRKSTKCLIASTEDDRSLLIRCGAKYKEILARLKQTRAAKFISDDAVRRRCLKLAEKGVLMSSHELELAEQKTNTTTFVAVGFVDKAKRKIDSANT